MQQERDRPEIEVTSDMIEAAAAELERRVDVAGFSYRDIAEAILLAGLARYPEQQLLKSS